MTTKATGATTFSGSAKRVRIYLADGQFHGHQPLASAILTYLQRQGAAGATALRGIEGFGSSGELHTYRLVDTDQRLPVVIEWIDTAERVERLLPQVTAMIGKGLVTVDATKVVLHRLPALHDIASTLQAADVMSQQLVSISPKSPIGLAVELLVGKSFRALPVLAQGRPVGIITNSDLLERAGLSVRVDLLGVLDPSALKAELARLAKGEMTARSVMTPDPVTVLATTPLTEVAEIMVTHSLKRLPVVDEQGQMLGMVSRLDVLRTAVRSFEGTEDASVSAGIDLGAPVSRSMRRDVPAVYLDTPLPEVLQAVVSTRLNRCVVVDTERRVRGQVTDCEILERVTPSLRPSVLRSLLHRLPLVNPRPEQLLSEQHASARVASDLMIESIMVRQEAPLAVAIENMLERGHKILPVVDEQHRLVGCLDRSDILHALLARP